MFRLTRHLSRCYKENECTYIEKYLRRVSFFTYFNSYFNHQDNTQNFIYAMSKKIQTDNFNENLIQNLYQLLDKYSFFLIFSHCIEVTYSVNILCNICNDIQLYASKMTPNAHTCHNDHSDHGDDEENILPLIRVHLYKSCGHQETQRHYDQRSLQSTLQ